MPRVRQHFFRQCRAARVPAVALLLGSLLMAPLTAGASEEALRTYIRTLADEIGERHVLRPHALLAAADYIRAVWEEQGYRVARREYDLDGRTWANLEVVRPGTMHPREVVLVGAHYDTVPGSPGANDNGSGVAALLELTRHFARRETARTLRFVAFVNEEPPFFLTGNMGSEHYARAARERGDDIRAMLCLETIGYYRDEPGSQHYPPFFSFFYPDRGDFLAFVANFSSRALMQEMVAAFRAASDFPVEHIATFGWVPGVDWSDHRSFWRAGYPAVMVTDTAPYRYPYYHGAQDTPDKVSYPELARVVAGLAAVIERLARGD
jgi:hypothetical protein